MFQINKSSLKSVLLLGGATAAAASLMTPAAHAQNEQSVETVVVTGSRIANRDFASDSPLSTISASALQQTGAVELTDLLATLPQVVPGFSPGSNNPPSGGEQKVDLRGLGFNRVVVLIDGRRAAPSDIDGTVDLQTIPQAMIDHVEVITGGASAVYGPDAITGVVNFVMKKDFQGVQADAQYGISGKGDDDEKTFSLLMGGNFDNDKGNITVSYDYAYRRPIFDTARGFADQATSATSRSPTGSYSPSTGNLPSQAAVDAYFAPYGAAAGAVPNNSAFGFNDNGTLFNYGNKGAGGVYNYASNPAYPATKFCANPSSAATCKTYSFNFQPYNLMIIPLKRQNFMEEGHYDINSDTQVYMNFKYTNYTSSESLAPTPAPTARVFTPTGPAGNSTSGYIVPVTNPYIPGALAGLLASRTGLGALPCAPGVVVCTPAAEDFLVVTRFLALGPRIQNNANDIFQGTWGVKGDMFLNLKYDIYASYGQLDEVQTQFGNVSNSAVENLLFGLGSGGCAGYGGLNPFGALKFSPASLACVQRITKNTQQTTFTNVEGDVTGTLWDLPAGPLSFSLGADYREQTYNFVADPLLSSGDVSGFTPSKSIAGAVYDQEAYGELYVPVLSNEDWAKSVSFTLGARYTEQAKTHHGNVWTEKAEGDWTVFDGLTLRGSFEVATRVPNINELFSTTAGSAPQLADPCDFNGPFRTGAHAAQVTALCAAQGAGAANFLQGNSQITIQSAGNPNVSPETADTFTVGAAWTSQFEDPWLSGMSGTLDYWNIDLHHPIGLNAYGILYGCYNFDGTNPTYSAANANCKKLSRSGASMYIFANFGNQIKAQEDGVDVAFNWALDLHDTIDADPMWGSLSFAFNGSYLNEYNITFNQGGTPINFAGTIGAQAPLGTPTDSALPSYKANLMATWQFGDASLGARFTYVDAMKNTLATVGWTGLPFGIGPVKGTPSTTYVDLFGDYQLMKGLTIRGGILNLLDHQPPQYNPSEQDGTDPAQYDIIGRRFFVGLNAKF